MAYVSPEAVYQSISDPAFAPRNLLHPYSYSMTAARRAEIRDTVEQAFVEAHYWGPTSTSPTVADPHQVKEHVCFDSVKHVQAQVEEIPPYPRRPAQTDTAALFVRNQAPIYPLLNGSIDSARDRGEVFHVAGVTDIPYALTNRVGKFYWSARDYNTRFHDRPQATPKMKKALEEVLRGYQERLGIVKFLDSPDPNNPCFLRLKMGHIVLDDKDETQRGNVELTIQASVKSTFPEATAYRASLGLFHAMQAIPRRIGPLLSKEQDLFALGVVEVNSPLAGGGTEGIMFTLSKSQLNELYYADFRPWRVNKKVHEAWGIPCPQQFSQPSSFNEMYDNINRSHNLAREQLWDALCAVRVSVPDNEDAFSPRYR